MTIRLRDVVNRRAPERSFEWSFTGPLEMTQKQLADHLGCDVKVINRIVNGRTSVSAAMSPKLGATFRRGRTRS